jgi:hypothetical protein
MAEEDKTALEKLPEYINLPESPTFTTHNVQSSTVVTHASATQEAVDLARQSIAIPAEEKTKQEHEITKRDYNATVKLAVTVGGVVAVMLIAPTLAPIAGGVAAGGWLLVFAKDFVLKLRASNVIVDAPPKPPEPTPKQLPPPSEPKK